MVFFLLLAALFFNTGRSLEPLVQGFDVSHIPTVLYGTWNQIPSSMARVNQHPPVHHPLDAPYNSVVEGPKPG